MSAAPTQQSNQEVLPDAVPRLGALERALTILAERVEEIRLRRARQVATRAGERLELSPNHTVVALAGATGSGKSSLFNALVGLDLSAVGVRRPTTGLPHACVWGPEGASDLLDWLGIPARLQAARESVLDADTQAELRGLALLDLPDHDSVEVAHRLEVDRLVELVDMLVWVLDPQKYADAAVHIRYLKELSRHASVLVVVLNQVDKLTQEQTELCIADLRRLLDEDGLEGVRLLATSATRGDGLADLRALLTDAVAAHAAVPARRVTADLETVAAGLSDLAGTEAREDVDRTAVKRLCATLALAAGVPAVGEAVERTYRQRARHATLFPGVRAFGWLLRLVRRTARPSAPTGVDLLYQGGSFAAGGGQFTGESANRTVLHAQAETALRDLADTAARGLPDPWPVHVRHAALAPLATLPDVLDAAVTNTELGLDHRPTWWAVSAWFQRTALAIGAAALGWLVATGVDGWSVPHPRIGGISVPLILAAVAVAAAVLEWVISWALAAEIAGRARAHAEEMLRDSVTVVAREHVLAPVRTQLRAYAQLRDALTTLRGR